ncbi:MAG TPA: ABC transporter permease [Acidimicrobiia bacterium]|nr:ABC transporter permease [Acidimicrobiia bacterium]HZI37083.1 ABC transporter permease [Acidimicrobiia bacterium]
MLAQLVDMSLWESVVRALIPVLLAAVGGLICERAGVFQISLEGMMLAGAFAAVAAAHVTGSALAAAVTAALAGVLLSLVLAFGAVSRGGNAIVLGVAINILAVGLTSFLLPQLFGVRGSFQPEGDVRILRLALPGLSDIPFLGPVLFNLSILGYLALLLVPAIWLFLFRTQLGLRLRGVGERPLAAETLGVSPTAYRYGAVIASGVLAGLAGAQLALGNVGVFTEGISSGRGWIAVVAVMLGRAHPFGVLAACLLFGFTEALGFRLQGQGYPVQITDALPFVVTLVALVIARKRFRRLLDLTASTV